MTKLFRTNGLKVILLLLDCLFIYSSFLLAYRLEFLSGIPATEQQSFVQYAPWLGLLTVFTYYFFNLYDLAGRRIPSKLLYNLVLAHIVFVAEMIVLSYWLKSFSVPKSIFFVALMLQLLFAFTLRLVIFGVQSTVIGKKRAVIVMPEGNTDLNTIGKLIEQGKSWFAVERIVAGSRAAKLAEEGGLDEIEALLLCAGLPPELKLKLVREAGERRIEVLLVPEFYELNLMGAEPQQIDDLMVYSVVSPHFTFLERFTKRLLDLLLAALMIAVASPVMLLMFLLIPATSKGKALFVQERVGRYGKSFPLYKFRSMVDNAEKSTGPVLASDRDPRITRLGAFIRATRIDELPQLFNVVQGQMSLVGPRPERAFFIDQFVKEIPHYTYRLMAKPGLTGLAQVMANYSTSPSDKLRYDLTYIRTYSPLLDIKILFQTIIVVLQREQSRGVASATRQADVERQIRQALEETAAGNG
ncbi:sugar transferase [Paenibacillus sp. NPDC058071]|uniref:sugar transferase n=1 Tax=Paenibacillus sp. NPDC058071 TaxID=3346326 RepID=UPI0036DE0F3A